MAIVLLVPLVLMILDSFTRSSSIVLHRLLHRQCHEMIHIVRLLQELGRPSTLHLEDYLTWSHAGAGRVWRWSGGDDLDSLCFRRLRHRWDSIPLSSDLVPGIAIGPHIVVYSLLCIHPHIFLARATFFMVT